MSFIYLQENVSNFPKLKHNLVCYFFIAQIVKALKILKYTHSILLKFSLGPTHRPTHLPRGTQVVQHLGAKILQYKQLH